jgi:Uma2 family endonuclease
MHPALVVEIAQSALRIARGRKAAAYARGGIDEYWILNLEDRVLEVRRAPAPMEAEWRYATVVVLGADAMVTPLAAPAANLRVDDLLP